MSTFIRGQVRALLQLESALHIGNGQLEQLGHRERSCHPYQQAQGESSWLSTVHLGYGCNEPNACAAIPASSLRGVWRNGCLRALQGRLDRWFGPAAGSASLHAGLLRIADLHLHQAAPNLKNEPLADLQRGTAVRHGIRMDPCSGTVEEKFLWAFEYVPAGSVFALEIDVVALADQPKSPTLRPIADVELFEVLNVLAELGKDGSAALGQGTSKGMGRFNIPREFIRVAVMRPDQLSLVTGQVQRWDQLTLVQLKPPARPPGQTENHRTTLIDLHFRDGLLVNEEGLVQPGQKRTRKASPTEAEQIQTTRTPEMATQQYSRDSEGRPRVPGSAIKGMLRARCRKIVLSTLREHHPQDTLAVVGDAAEQVVSTMFGDVRHRSHINVSDAIWQRQIDPATTTFSSVHTRVAIDRFTGSVLDGALFDANVANPCVLRVQIELLPSIKDWQVGLLLHVLRDAMDGDLHLGSGNAHGLGRFQAKLVRGGTPALPVDVPGNSEELRHAVLASDTATRWLMAFDRHLSEYPIAMLDEARSR